MRIEHIALWTRDVERMRAFYERYFGATAGARPGTATTKALFWIRTATASSLPSSQQRGRRKAGL